MERESDRGEGERGAKGVYFGKLIFCTSNVRNDTSKTASGVTARFHAYVVLRVRLGDLACQDNEVDHIPVLPFTLGPWLACCVLLWWCVFRLSCRRRPKLNQSMAYYLRKVSSNSCRFPIVTRCHPTVIVIDDSAILSSRMRRRVDSTGGDSRVPHLIARRVAQAANILGVSTAL